MKKLFLLLSLFLCSDVFSFVNLRRSTRAQREQEANSIISINLFDYKRKLLFGGYINNQGNPVITNGQGRYPTMFEYRTYTEQYPELSAHDFLQDFTMPDGTEFYYDPPSGLIHYRSYDKDGVIRLSPIQRITPEQQVAYDQKYNMVVEMEEAPF